MAFIFIPMELFKIQGFFFFMQKVRKATAATLFYTPTSQSHISTLRKSEALDVC